mgnify:CR=1 FL=1
MKKSVIKYLIEESIISNGMEKKLMNESMKSELYQSIQYIAQSYLSSYESVSDQRAVTIADKETIKRLRNIGFPKTGRPLKV